MSNPRPSISFAVTTHNEGEYVSNLMTQLAKLATIDDEIVVVDDYSVDPLTIGVLEELAVDRVIQLHKREFQGNFADHKNFLLSKCTKDYIFNIDADEQLGNYIESAVKDILMFNPEVDAFWVPRTNIVKGITENHMLKWRWTKHENGINWPDWQMRIFKNHKGIKFTNKVHETIVNVTTTAFLPEDISFALIHEKTIDRQEKQNEFYEQILNQ